MMACAGKSLARSPRRRGAAAVEMAFVVPVLFAVIFGIIEFSRMWFVVHTLNEVARGACRQAISMQTGTTGQWSSDVKTAAKARAAALLGFDSSRMKVDIYVAGSNTKDISTATGFYATSTGYVAGDEIRVHIMVYMKDVAWIPAQFLGGVLLQTEYRLNRE
jgi:Flp pilus assembly protein TadG